MKFCKDCKHVRNPQDDQTWWKCDLTKTIRLTDGSTRYEQCSITRLTLSACGEAARWFEAKKPA